MMYQYNVSINQLPQSYNNPNNDLEFLSFINYCSEKKRTFWTTTRINLPALDLCALVSVFSLSLTPLPHSLLLLERLLIKDSAVSIPIRYTKNTWRMHQSRPVIQEIRQLYSGWTSFSVALNWLEREAKVCCLFDILFVCILPLLEYLTRVGRNSWRFNRGFQSFRTRWRILSRTRPVPFRRRADDKTVVITHFPIVPSDDVSFIRQNSDVHKCYKQQQTNQSVRYDP